MDDSTKICNTEIAVSMSETYGITELFEDTYTEFVLLTIIEW